MTLGIHNKPLPTYTLRAWTGGKSDWRSVKHPDFGWLRRYLFRQMYRESGVPLGFWACAGTSALERARILWNRARLDAMATLNLN